MLGKTSQSMVRDTVLCEDVKKTELLFSSYLECYSSINPMGPTNTAHVQIHRLTILLGSLAHRIHCSEALQISHETAQMELSNKASCLSVHQK